jgi:PB1 domain
VGVEKATTAAGLLPPSVTVQALDGKWRYQGGESYAINVATGCSYSELVFRLSEKLNGAVDVKYILPGEELDPDGLICVRDDDDVQVRTCLWVVLSYFCSAPRRRLARKARRRSTLAAAGRPTGNV